METSSSVLKGPLSDEALEIFTRHLCFLCDQEMVLDPESSGHEMYQHGGRYQWKIEGGRSADRQGVALKISGDPEIYFIRHNRIDVIVRIRVERDRTYDELIRNNVDEVLPPTFKLVLTEMMEPYDGLI